MVGRPKLDQLGVIIALLVEIAANFLYLHHST